MEAIVNRKILSIFAVAVFLISVLAVPLALAVPTPVSTYDPYAKGNGPAGKSNTAHLYLVEKNPTDWTIVPDGAWGKMKYNLAGPTFNFVFNGHGLEPNEDYTLIYYGDATHNDVWPFATCIASGTTDNEGNIHLAESKDFGFDLTDAKIWLVLSGDVNCDAGEMIGWNPTEYLFEYDVIDYDDTNA